MAEAGIPLQGGIIYGPIRSRRLGISLGINVLSPHHKTCTFDCIYCQYGSTTRSTGNPGGSTLYKADRILAELEKGLRLAGRLDAIAFSGNGEPTLHPDFPLLIRESKMLREKYRPGIPIAVFTNGSTLDRAEIFKSLESIDLPLVKLDAGDHTTFIGINRTIGGIQLEDIAASIKPLKHVVLQSLFMKGKFQNCEGEPYLRWLELAGWIQPARIQVYTLDAPLEQAGLLPLQPRELIKIAGDIQTRLGIQADATWQPVEWLR